VNIAVFLAKEASAMTEALEIEKAQRILEEYRYELFDKPGVTALMIDNRRRNGKKTDEICLRVLVEAKLPPEALSPEDMIQPVLVSSTGESVGTDIEEVGRLITSNSPKPKAGRVIFPVITPGFFGTLGGFALDASTDRVVALTCNHVVTQRVDVPPGNPHVYLDAGYKYLMGRTSRISYLELKELPGHPKICESDSAIVELSNQQNYDEIMGDTGYPGIYDIGYLKGEETVYKVGATTGMTSGFVPQKYHLEAQAVVELKEEPGKKYRYIHKAFLVEGVPGPFSQEGDSGALVFRNDPKLEILGIVVGHFEKTKSVCCYIDKVFSDLNIVPLKKPKQPKSLALLEMVARHNGHAAANSRVALRRLATVLHRFEDAYSEAPVGKLIFPKLFELVPSLEVNCSKDSEFREIVCEALAPFVLLPTVKDIEGVQITQIILQNCLRGVNALSELSDENARSFAHAIRPVLGRAAGKSVSELFCDMLS
jgi:hypothetical protein